MELHVDYEIKWSKALEPNFAVLKGRLRFVICKSSRVDNFNINTYQLVERSFIKWGIFKGIKMCWFFQQEGVENVAAHKEADGSPQS